MSPQPAALHPDPAPSIAPEDIEHLRRTLIDMVGLGATCVRIFVAEAAANPLPGPYDREVPIPHPTEFIALCFESATRAIRRSAELACTIGQQPGHPAPAPAAEMVVYLRRTLIETVDLGAQLTRIVVGQLTAPPIPHPLWGDEAPTPHPAAHVANCYDRLSRAVRRSAELAVTIGQPRPAPAKPRPAPARPCVVVSNDEPAEPRDRPSAGQPHRDAPCRDKPDWHEPPEDFGEDQTRPPQDVINEIAQDLEAAATQAGLPPTAALPPLPLAGLGREADQGRGEGSATSAPHPRQEPTPTPEHWPGPGKHGPPSQR